MAVFLVVDTGAEADTIILFDIGQHVTWKGHQAVDVLLGTVTWLVAGRPSELRRGAEDQSKQGSPWL